jgi:nucleotide-binding universal stress UspA family protein
MFKKILVPSDLSEQSMPAVRQAVEWARLCNAELVMLNVRPEFMSKEEMVLLRVSAYDFVKDERDTAVAAKKILEEELARAGGSEIRHQVLLREGEPVREILETAEKTGCDLIIITTTGRTGLLEHLRGSDAEHLVKETEIPILVLPVQKSS